MKKYLPILAYYIAVITVSVLVGTALVLTLPWWALIPMMIIATCACAYIDYRRFFSDNNNNNK